MALKDVDQIDVYSGYGWPNVASGTSSGRLGSLVSVPGTAATVDQLRLVVTDPSDNATDIARVYEVAAH